MRLLPFFAWCLGWLLLPAAAQALDKQAPQILARDGASLQVYAARHALHFAPAPGADAAASARTLAELLRAWTDVSPGSAWRLGFGRYDELNARMAAIAACSPEWDARRGRPRQQPAGPWLQRALAAPASYGELGDALQAAGWRVEIAAIESVLLCTPAQVRWDLAPRRCEPAPAGSARLPCAGLVTFRITAP